MIILVANVCISRGKLISSGGCGCRCHRSLLSGQVGLWAGR
ncbi:hypothetical protein [Moraxella lacunata]